MSWKCLACSSLLAAAALTACGGGGSTGPGGGGGGSPTIVEGPPAGTDLGRPGYMAFDGSGNLWLSAVSSDLTSGFVVEYTLAQLKAGGRPAPAVVLAGFDAPFGLAFDASDHLWVLDVQYNPSDFSQVLSQQLFRFDPSQLTQSGSPAPAQSLSLAGLNGSDYTYIPQTFTFDAQGDAWLSASLGSNAGSPADDSLPLEEVAELTAAELAAGGSPTPATTLVEVGAGHPGGYGPGVAFDSLGNLWTANTFLQSLTKFTAGTLTPGGNPLPAVTLASGNGDLDHVAALGFDSAGNLLAAAGIHTSIDKQKVLRYPATALVSSGSPAPDLTYVPPNNEGVSNIITSPELRGLRQAADKEIAVLQATSSAPFWDLIFFLKYITRSEEGP